MNHSDSVLKKRSSSTTKYNQQQSTMPLFDSMLKGVSSLMQGGIQSLFDAGKFKVEVKVERPNFANMHLTSEEGGSISGFVIINCSAPATIRGFTLTHAVRSSFITQDYMSVKQSNQVAIRDAYKRIKKSKPVYKQEYVLFGSRNGAEISVKPGQYVYPFSIKVDSWVAGSSTASILGEFSDCCSCCCSCCGGHFLLGGLLHSLDVKVIIAQSFLDHNFDKDVEVQRAAPNELVAHPRPLDFQYAASSKNCCCGCPGGGQIDLRIRLPRKDWIIGLDQAIVGRFSGRANVAFQLVLLSTTKLSKKMRSKVDFTHADELVETKVVKTSYKQSQAGYQDERSNGGRDFSIPIPKDIPASFGDGNPEQLFHISIVYTLVALPLNSMCSFEFEEPTVPIVLNLWKGLAAARKDVPPPQPPQQQHHHHHHHHQQQQHHHHGYQHHHHHQQHQGYHHHHHHQQMMMAPPPTSNFAPSGDIPCFERVYAYQQPPTDDNFLPENTAPQHDQQHQPSAYGGETSRQNLKFNPAFQVTENDLEAATWGNVVEAADTIPNNAYQIPPPGDGLNSSHEPSY